MCSNNDLSKIADDIKSENPESNARFLYCDGCLSIDRKIRPMSRYLDLWLTLFNFDKQDYMRTNMMLCWACEGMLYKIQNFIQCVQKAQQLLQQGALLNGMNTLLLSPLSNLQAKKCAEAIIIVHEENASDVTQNSNFIQDISSDETTKGNYLVGKEDLENSDEEIDPDQNLDAYVLTTEDNKTNVNARKKRKYVKKLEIVRMKFNNREAASYFKIIHVTDKEVFKLLETEKKNVLYKCRPFKCKTCVCGYVNEKSFKKHKEHNHSVASGLYSCSVCECRLPSKRRLSEHTRTHLRYYECTLCKYTCLHRNLQKPHVQRCHCIRYKCNMCPSYFMNKMDFRDHYDELHINLICDYCGKKFFKKRLIESHIKRNHASHECKLCHRHYKTYHSLENHYRMRHPFMINENLKREDSYCVECDKQFESVYKYKNHLRSSIRHTAPKRVSVPCPECGKLFSKKTYMNNHLQLAHIKRTKHYCAVCDKYFITPFSLRQHKQTVHDKIVPPRDKICAVCNKAFNTNRSMIYHMRTHTGEKPFMCEYCPARFSQKIAMKTHIKTVHSKNKIVNLFLTQYSNNKQ